MVHIRLEEIEKYANINNIPIMQKDGIEFLCDYIKEKNIEVKYNVNEFLFESEEV